MLFRSNRSILNFQSILIIPIILSIPSILSIPNNPTIPIIPIILIILSFEPWNSLGNHTCHFSLITYRLSLNPESLSLHCSRIANSSSACSARSMAIRVCRKSGIPLNTGVAAR